MSSLAPGQAAPSIVTDRRDGVGRSAAFRRLLSLRQLRDGGLDLRNTWQIVAGAILLPLGVAVILLGWAGAAHGRVDQQQIPYLISGGVLGLALVIVGCFFYWAHWLYRIYDQADVHRQAAAQEHAELVQALLQVAGAGAVGTRAGAVAAVAAGDAGVAATYVATPTGTNFHVPGCAIVASRVATLRTVTSAEAAKMRPCRICDPLATD